MIVPTIRMGTRGPFPEVDRYLPQSLVGTEIAPEEGLS